MNARLRPGPCALLLLAPLVSAQVEVGGNDVRLSHMGPDGDPAYDAGDTAVAFNPVDNEYLVVWVADDDTPPQVDDELEVFAQRVDARTGVPLGEAIRISDMGPAGLGSALMVDVAYNPTQHEYLVVWSGSELPKVGSFEFEIHIQRLEAATGQEVGPNDRKISSVGLDGDPFRNAYYPAVAYNATSEEYLVVWEGRDFPPAFDYQIQGQRLDSLGAQIGADDFRISDAGELTPNSALRPQVAWNSADNEYLVVWMADDDPPPLVTGENEIWGQRIDGTTGAEVGANDFRISDAGPEGTPFHAAVNPSVAYNPSVNEYLVVWAADEDLTLSNHLEIHGQRIDAATGVELGVNDFPISEMGLPGDSVHLADNPAVAWQGASDEYVVLWSGSDDDGTMALLEFDIFLQRLDGTSGAEVGPDDARVSDMGPGLSSLYDARAPDVAVDQGLGWLVVWNGDDDTGSLVEGETEIFLQLHARTTSPSEIMRIGSPPNPVAFLPGVTTPPLVQSTWDPVVDHAGFVPGAVLDIAAVSPVPIEVPFAGGSLLVDLGSALTYAAAPGIPFAVPIPGHTGLVGLALYAQAASWDGVTATLTNGIDVVVGAQ